MGNLQRENLQGCIFSKCDFYASAFRRRRHYVFGLSVRPSVHPSEARNTLFPPVLGSVGPSDQPWPFYSMSVHPSVRPERFPGICWRTHGGNGLKFCMLMYLDHLQNWLDYGHGLLNFLLLAPLWLSEMGQIWGFRAFPGEHMGGMGSEILHADVSWPYSEMISWWLPSVDFSNFGTILS